MKHIDDSKSTTQWSKDDAHLVPKITSLILEGLPLDEDTIIANPSKLFAPHLNTKTNQFKWPKINSVRRQHPIKKISKATYGGRRIHVAYHRDRIQTVRSFIGNLSHHYNNLLMGIWGNNSLLGLQFQKDHPIQFHLEQIEGLIQNGSNLIHLLFGYITERRTVTKRLRLDQLIQEMKIYNQIGGNQIDFTLIMNSLIGLSKIQKKVQLAACISSVIAQMLNLIQKKCLSITQNTNDWPEAEPRLTKMDELLKRGLQMVRNLEYYSVSITPDTQKIHPEALVQSEIDKINGSIPSDTIKVNISGPLPRIKIDPNQIRYAFRQVVDNAVDALDLNRKIHIQVNTLNSEDPKERCGVHGMRDYVVITVTDSGCGMATAVQAHVFDPFFTYNRGRNRTGLGLAAAAGIIKSHFGFMQVRSKLGYGSCVKIYLPE